MNAITRTARLYTYLDGSGHSVSEVGGKGAGLDLLLEHGFPIPQAIVITAAAYEGAIAEHSLHLLVKDMIDTAPPRVDHMAAEAAAIERAFLAAPLPETVRTAVTKVGTEILRGSPVAVRSSATAEDMAEASFAGQYLTVTDVEDEASLEVAIRRCWASLWMPSARAYRRRHSISERRLAMAVVVQRQVKPEWSGVTFTTDPQGRDHLLRIEAVRGMGEALVSGRVTPDDFLVRKDTLEVVASSHEDVPDFIEDVARLGLRIERTLGSPQDIEWAYSTEGLTLLQVRAITGPKPTTTVDDGFDSDPEPQATYTPHGVIEMLPGVVPPLLWSINAPMLENAFRATFANLGGQTPPSNRRVVSRFRGRAALDLSAICDIADSLPGGDPAEVERQYLGQSISEPKPKGGKNVQLFAALRGRTAHKRIVDEVYLTADAASAIAGINIDLTQLPVRKLVAYRQRIRDLAWRGYEAEVGASSAAGATYRALELLLERWMPAAEASAWAPRLTVRSIDHTSLGGGRAAELAALLGSHGTPEILRLVSSRSPRSRIVDVKSGPEFLEALDATIRVTGSKAVYGDATWGEDEGWVWQQLRLVASDDWRRPRGDGETNNAVKLLSSRLAGDKRWKRTRLLTGQIVDVRMRWLLRQVEETTQFLELRERAKSALLVLGGEERRTIVESARRLVASRQLPSADLVAYVTDQELEGMLFGSCGITRTELETRRSVARTCNDLGPLPDWFSGSPDKVDLPDIPTGGRLKGWATSPGQALGRVCVVSSLDDGVRLRPGDVLVAHASDPSWTPLFLAAGAVVLETGGPLSHAAIVAREFGLPAVLNVPHATRILHDEETVRVDGTLGIVDRVEEVSQ